MEPYFDRFDIAEAYWMISIDFNPCEKIDRRLKQMQFKPGILLYNEGFSALSDNAKAIYHQWVVKNWPEHADYMCDGNNFGR